MTQPTTDPSDPTEQIVLAIRAGGRIEVIPLEPESELVLADIMEKAAAQIRSGEYRAECADGCQVHQHEEPGA